MIRLNLPHKNHLNPNHFILLTYVKIMLHLLRSTTCSLHTLIIVSSTYAIFNYEPVESIEPI